MLTMQQEQGLAVARLLVKAGMPVFLAYPDPSSPQGFKLPLGWQQTECDPSIVDQWQPGMALCAVTGRAFDLVDIDPRSGGTEELIPMPHSYLAAETPSGGRHHFVSAIGVASRDGVAPGVDLKSGTLEGTGRGFAFIAPTVRRSKVDGVEREYRWYLGPDGPGLPTADQRAADGSGALLRARVLELRRAAPMSAEARRVPLSVAVREFDKATRGLANDVRRWAVTGWGGEAHAGLLAATTHLARLNHAQAESAFRWAFAAAGVTPDDADLQKLYSAIERAVPDIIVPDDQLSAQERFLMGADSPLGLDALASASVMPVAGVGAGMTEPVPGVEGRRRFQPMSRDQAASIEAPAALIDGLLLSNTKARVSAPPGAGKTWVVLDVAAHVAAGLPWQGRAVTRTRVLYVAGEGAPSFDTRLRAWEAKHGRRAEVDIVPEAPQVADESWDQFLYEISQMNYGLIIFDTQGSITVGLEENSNKDANITLARLDQVRRISGACVLTVHHTGWEENGRPRGASAMFGGMDTELVLSGTLADLKLTSAKQKYVEAAKPMRLALDKFGGGRVVRPMQATQNAADGFFGDVRQTEHEAKIQAMVDRLRAWFAAGGRSATTVRALVQVLRVELNVKGRNEELREAAQRYTASVGMPVDLSPNQEAG